MCLNINSDRYFYSCCSYYFCYCRCCSVERVKRFGSVDPKLDDDPGVTDVETSKPPGMVTYGVLWRKPVAFFRFVMGIDQ